MKQPDLYYFETIKMTSQALSNFVWRIRATGENSLWTLTRLVTSFLWFQNSIDHWSPTRGTGHRMDSREPQCHFHWAHRVGAATTTPAPLSILHPPLPPAQAEGAQHRPRETPRPSFRAAHPRPAPHTSQHTGQSPAPSIRNISSHPPHPPQLPRAPQNSTKSKPLDLQATICRPPMPGSPTPVIQGTPKTIGISDNAI